LSTSVTATAIKVVRNMSVARSDSRISPQTRPKNAEGRRRKQHDTCFNDDWRPNLASTSLSRQRTSKKEK